MIPDNELRIYRQIKILERQSFDENKFISWLLIPFSQNKTTLIATSTNDDPVTYWWTLFYTAYLEKKMFDMYLKRENE